MAAVILRESEIQFLSLADLRLKRWLRSMASITESFQSLKFRLSLRNVYCFNLEQFYITRSNSVRLFEQTHEDECASQKKLKEARRRSLVILATLVKHAVKWKLNFDKNFRRKQCVAPRKSSRSEMIIRKRRLVNMANVGSPNLGRLSWMWI